MRDINTITIAGRLCKDVDLKVYTKVGTTNDFTVGTFTIASHLNVPSNGQWNDYTSFLEVRVLGNSAKNLAPYLKKGTKVAVTGTLRQERWTTDSGDLASRIMIIADNIYFIGSKQNDTEGV